MFKDLFLLEKDRTARGALGFYLAYFFVSALVGALLSYLLVPYDPSMTFMQEYQAGYTVGQYFSIIVCLALSFGILYKKKKLQNFGLVLVAILSGFCAVFLGTLLGLVLTAYLTTIKKQ